MRPLGVFGPSRPARGKTPAEATETLTYVVNHEICAETDKKKKKHVGAVGDPSDHLDPPEKHGPLTNYKGPSKLSGAL